MESLLCILLDNRAEMKRTDLLDTSIEMHKRRIALLREKGPEWKFRRAFEMFEEMRRFREAVKVAKQK